MNRIVLIALLVAVLLTVITAHEMRKLDAANPSDVSSGPAISAQPGKLIPAGAVTHSEAMTLPDVVTPPEAVKPAPGEAGEQTPPAAAPELSDRSETPVDPDHPSQRFLHSRRGDGQHAE